MSCEEAFAVVEVLFIFLLAVWSLLSVLAWVVAKRLGMVCRGSEDFFFNGPRWLVMGFLARFRK
jgi:hypothetical protein